MNPEERTELRRKGPVCRFCRRSVDWKSVKTDDKQVGARTYHRVYYCPHCRGVLEYASWISR